MEPTQPPLPLGKRARVWAFVCGLMTSQEEREIEERERREREREEREKEKREKMVICFKHILNIFSDSTTSVVWKDEESEKRLLALLGGINDWSKDMLNDMLVNSICCWPSINFNLALIKLGARTFEVTSKLVRINPVKTVTEYDLKWLVVINTGKSVYKIRSQNTEQRYADERLVDETVLELIYCHGMKYSDSKFVYTDTFALKDIPHPLSSVKGASRS
jgi:hypothetical protein